MKKPLLLLALASLFFISCSDKKEQIDETAYQTERLTELLPLKKGKYITYRVDSTLFPPPGTSTLVRSYQVKHEVNDSLTDNLGRAGFKIYRYIRDAAGTGEWKPDGTYFITPLSNRVEVIEDNLRVIKLVTPVKEDYTWKGNSFLPIDAYGQKYNFSNDDFLDQWEFTYGPEQTETIGTQSINNVRTVFQVDASQNVNNGKPAIDTNYAERNFSIEKYAKNIGLVYRETVLWEHQDGKYLQSPGPPPKYAYLPYTIGFGIKMWMIDHN